MDEKLVIQITAEIDDLKRQVADAKQEVRDMAEDTKKSSAEIDETFKQAGESIKNGMKVAAVGIAGAITALVALGPATEEYRKNQALLAAAFETTGSSAETAKATYNDLYRVLGDSGQATEAAQHLAKLTSEEEALAEWTNICQGVYAQFGDSLAIEGLTEAVNHTAKLGEVQGTLADALEWSGVSVDDFNAKLAQCNTEAEREQLIRETLNSMYSESAAAYEQQAAGILAANEAQAQLDAALATTGEVMAPVMTMLKELAADVLTALAPYIQEFAENYLPVIRDVLGEVGTKLTEAIEWMKEHQTLLAAIGIAIGVIITAIGLYNAAAAIKVAMDAAQVTTLGALIAAQAASAAATLVALAPYVAIAAAIAAVIAIIVLCIKNWDKIKDTVVKVAKAIGDKVSDMASKIKQKFEDIQKTITDKIEAAKQKALEKFEQIKTGIQDRVQAIKENAVNKFNEIKQGITDRINAVKTSITDVFTNIKTAMSDKINDAKSAILGTFDKLKQGISDKLNQAKSTVSSLIEKIKGILDFNWSLPKLKLPHLTVTGKLDLFKIPPSIPKVSVSWYAKGGVFDNPTLFGYGGGIGGLGENGAEAVVPLENNLEWLDKLAGMLDDRMQGNGKSTPIILQVDGKTLAQVSVDNINKLTRQTGKMPLVIA